MLFWLLLRVAVRLTVLIFPGNGWVGFGYRLKWHEDRVLLYGWAALALSNFVSGYEMWLSKSAITDLFFIVSP